MKNMTYAIVVLAFISNSVFAIPAFAAEVVGGGGAKTKASSKPGESVKKVEDETPTAEEVTNGAVKSPYKTCEGFVMVEAAAYTKNKKYWDGFSKNCDSKVVNCNRKVQTIPDTGMFKSFSGKTGQNLSSQLSAVAFLDKVAEKSIEKMKTGIGQYEKLQQCVSGVSGGASSDAACGTMIGNLKARIEKNTPAFRKSLALMMEADPNMILRSIVNGDSTVLINKTLSAVSAKAIAPKIPALDTTEFATIKSEVDEALKKASKEWDAETSAMIAKRGLSGSEAETERKRLMEPRNYSSKVRATMDKKREEATMQYLKVLSDAPELAYIADSKASQKDMSKALGSMLEDLRDNLASMQKSRSKRSEAMSSDKMDSSLMRFAANTRVIEDMLASEREKGSVSSCAVATAVHNELQSVKGQSAVLGIASLISLPFATVGVAAGASRFMAAAGAARLGAAAGNLAIAEGVIGGVAMTGMDINDQLDLTRDAKTGVVKWEDAKDTVSGIGASVAMAPFDFVGGKVLLGGAAGLAAKGIGKLATGAIVRGKLTAKATAKEVEALSLAAQKGDVAAMKRLAEIAQDGEKSLLGGRAATASEREAVDTAGAKGYLGDTTNPDVALVRSMGEETKGLAAEQRTGFGDRLKKLFSGLKPASEQGGAARVAEVKELAVDMANLVPNPDEAAKVLNNAEFDANALRGMRVITDEVKKGAGPVDDRTREAIAQARYKKPFARLDEAQKKEVGGMCGCMKICPTGKTVSMVDGLEVVSERFVCSAERH